MDSFTFAVEGPQILALLSRKYPNLSPAPLPTSPSDAPAIPPPSPLPHSPSHSSTPPPPASPVSPHAPSSAVDDWQEECLDVICEVIKNSENALICSNFKKIIPSPQSFPILIQFSPQQHVVIVQDSGIGMSKSDLISFLGVIGRSGTKIFRDKISESALHSLPPFVGSLDGISFYSLFLIAEKVQVYSRHEETVHLWQWNDEQTFTIETIPPPTPVTPPADTTAPSVPLTTSPSVTSDPTIDASALVAAVPQDDYLACGTKVIIYLRSDRHSLLDREDFETKLRQRCERCISHTIHFGSPLVCSTFRSCSLMSFLLFR